MNMEKLNTSPLPTEILSNIFSHLDGPSLIACKLTCHHWHNLINWYDDLIWPNACQIDFGKVNAHNRRFWSVQFPSPTSLVFNKPTWQDMYRITYNWYHGYASGQYAEPRSTSQSLLPCTVIGAPQEQGIFTTLTLSHEKQVIRSNPNYHLHRNSTLLTQSPQTNHISPLQMVFNENISTHAIVCHYTHPSSNYIVTGALNGTVGVWDLTTKSLIRMWQGHRSRVLCISMNERVVVSGSSDNMIRVWDLDGSNANSVGWTNHRRPARRGMIDISSYLSGTSEWYQGVGEIAVNGHLIACAPDASGPILIFSLLTGALVYELRSQAAHHGEWMTEDITFFTKLCLTPFFLLTRGKVANRSMEYPHVPARNNVVLQRRELQAQHQSSAKPAGYRPPPATVPASRMTPYQLYQYYQTIQPLEDLEQVPSSSVCINVWDLQTGKIIYQLLPVLDNPCQDYSITDIRLSPDYSTVFASIEIRGARQYEEKLFCWDFSIKNETDSQQRFDLVELEKVIDTSRKNGKSWVCLM